MFGLTSGLKAAICMMKQEAARKKGAPMEKLYAPAIEITDNTLSITDTDGRATSFDIYDGDDVIGNVQKEA